MTEDPRADKVAGCCGAVDACWCEGPEEFSGSVVIVADFCLPSSGIGFLSTVDALLPMLFRCTGELDSSNWNARCVTGDGVVA